MNVRATPSVPLLLSLGVLAVQSSNGNKSQCGSCNQLTSQPINQSTSQRTTVMQRTLTNIAIVLLAALACGCPSTATPAPIVVATQGVAPAVDYSNLSAVLGKVVTSDGLISCSALRESTARLDAQLALLAITGPSKTPQLFPTDDDRAAYWLNARAAWAMKLAQAAGCPRESIEPALLLDRQFNLDGRMMNLPQIDAILAADRDWRTDVVAPCVCLERAALPARPFTGKDVRGRIEAAFDELVNDPRRFKIDVAAYRVLVPMALWDRREQLTREYDREYGGQGPHC